MPNTYIVGRVASLLHHGEAEQIAFRHNAALAARVTADLEAKLREAIVETASKGWVSGVYADAAHSQFADAVISRLREKGIK